MKKLERLTLKELGSSCDLLEPREANCLKGGTTVEEMDAQIAAGTWTGGQVDGMGYVAGVVTVTPTPTTNMIGECGITITHYCSACYAADHLMSGTPSGAAGFQAATGWMHIWGMHEEFIQETITRYP